MSTSTLAISSEHVEFAEAAFGLLQRLKSISITRAAADGLGGDSQSIWKGAADLGWNGLTIDERHGGSGFGLPELTIVLEAMGHELCPGPFLPTSVLATFLNSFAPDALQAKYLPGLASGEFVGAVVVGDSVRLDNDGTATGHCAAVLGAPEADILAVVAGDDVIVFGSAWDGVSITPARAALDASRSIGDVLLNGVQINTDQVIAGGAVRLRTLWRILAAAEAVGIARATMEMACEYAKVREQFGRTIATFQAVKHHLANMLIDNEMATAAVWDAARAEDIDSAGFAAAVAAWQAARAVLSNAQTNIQVHGGIGFTWEHDAHLYLRRARTLAAALSGDDALADIVEAQRTGRATGPSFTLPAEAERFRAEARATAAAARALSGDLQREYLVDSGYLTPHWPAPFGRGAGVVEQLVIDEEFEGIAFPDMGISGWVMLTIVQAGNDEQRARWADDVLRGRQMWCQLFSEPNAGSDAAAVRTSAVKVDGGWRVTGQKVWTSLAQDCQWGLATVRTDPDGPKHAGVTMMAIDMNAEGVDVRPLRELTGDALFNEVFLDNVFVPDADVVGEVGQGWKVARATLGNERVSIGGGSGSMSITAADALNLLDKTSETTRQRFSRRVGEVIAETYTLRPLNIRMAARALAGTEPGAEANVTKLLQAESSQHLSELAMDLAGGAAVTGEATDVIWSYLMSRCLTIAGGTSEVMRNTIAERILGLPRDPLAR